MPRVKTGEGTARKAAAKRSIKKAVARKAAPTAASKTSLRSRKATPKATAPKAATGISEEQAVVTASKFASVEPQTSKVLSRPTLPVSYGESHLLLLVRDPQTLFAAWDVSPSTVESLKARIGARSLAVSNMTLRLFREGGVVTVFHLTKKARSRYIKIDGNSPSFVAEIGFTTPAGRFELIARSAPCFVPLGLAPRVEGGVRRAVIGYREARALVRRGLASAGPGSRARARKGVAGASTTPSSSTQALSTRVLGGASDLYRR